MRPLRCLFVLCLLPMLAQAQEFSRADWIADFDQLTALLATNYPDLEWHARRGVDLAGIASRARAAPERGQDVVDARGVLERFLARLDDAHLPIEWDSKPPDPADDASLPDCVRVAF